MKLALTILLAVPLASQPTVDHVIVIGVDGLHVDGVSQGKVPALREMMRTGAWTLNARGVMPTVSSPNWASMIMGAGPEQHGVTSNEWERHRFEFPPACKGSDDLFPTMFGLLKSQRPASAVAIFYEWKGFARLVENGVPSVMKHLEPASKTVEAALRYWREHKPALLFVHLDLVDHAGHGLGWKTPEYFKAVEEADGYIGQFVRTAPGALVLVTADHGGVGKKHGGMTMDELRIPWIVAGPGVTAGHEIKGSVNTFDTAATIAWLLRLKAPDCWIGKPVRDAFGR